MSRRSLRTVFTATCLGLTISVSPALAVPPPPAPADRTIGPSPVRDHPDSRPLPVPESIQTAMDYSTPIPGRRPDMVSPPAPAAPAPERPLPRDGFTERSRWVTNADGTVTMTLYETPAFRRAGNTWEPVDGRVVATGVAAHPYANPKAARPMRFGARADSVVVVDRASGDLTMSTPGLRIGTPERSGTTLTYRGVAKDTDLVVEPTSSGVRQITVLRSAAAPRSFRYHLSDPTGSLGDVVRNADGSYHFTGTSNGETVRLEPANAYEQERARSNDIQGETFDPRSAHQSVIRSGDGFDIVETVNGEWLKGKSFPIALDPVLTIVGADGVADADCHLVNAPYDTTSFCSSTVAEIGYMPTQPYARRMLLQFPLSSIPTGSYVEAATLSATYVQRIGTAVAVPVDLHAMSRGNDWVNPSWKDRMRGIPWPTAGGSPGASVQASASVSTVGAAYSWNATNIVRELFNDDPSGDNRGMLLKASSEQTQSTIVRLATSEDTTASRRPSLSVTYSAVSRNVAVKVTSTAATSATVSWNAPNGVTPTSYVVKTTRVSDNVVVAETNVGGATTHTVTSLTAGAGRYKYEVSAVTAAGTGRATLARMTPLLSAPRLSQTLTGAQPGGRQVTVLADVSNPDMTFPMYASVRVDVPAQWTAAPGSFKIGTGVCRPAYREDCSLAYGTITYEFFVAAGQTATVSFDAVLRAPLRWCESAGLAFDDVRASNIMERTTGRPAATSAALAPILVCDAALGYEDWWGTVDRALGPNAKASLNVANGNLVVQQEDSTPVRGHGALALSLRRTYNSQDAGMVSLPGALGAGWTLNIGQITGASLNTAVGSALYVPPAARVTAGAAPVTLIDRDGTRHTFTPRSLSAPLHAPKVGDAGALTGKLAPLSPRMLALPAGTTNICVDTTYEAPAGVHLSLWRYLAVSAVDTTVPCAGESNWTSVSVLGFAAERPDRLRTEFNQLGQVTSVQDGAGNQIVYTYAAVTGKPGTWPDSIYEASTPSRKLTFAYSGTTTTVTDPAGRATKYTFSSDPLLAMATADDPKPLAAYLLQVDGPDGGTWNYTYHGVANASCGANSAGVNGASTGQLCSVTNPLKKTTHFTYATKPSSRGRIDTIKDRRDVVTRVSYAYGTPAASTDNTRVDTNWLGTDTDGAEDPHVEVFRIDNDPAGRVQLYDQGRGADDGTVAVTHRVLNYWDGQYERCSPDAPGTSNFLCSTKVLIDSTSITTPVPYNGRSLFYTHTGGVIREYTYNEPKAHNTTYGYRTTYVQADGSVRCRIHRPSGNGEVAIGDGASPAACTDTADENTLYAVTDQTSVLSARGNDPADAGLVPFDLNDHLTTFTVDSLATAAPNTSPTTATCAGAVATGDTGLVCQVKGPVNGIETVDGAATRVRPVSCFEYDSYGAKTREVKPAALAAGDDCGSLTADTADYEYTYYTSGTALVSSTVPVAGWLRGVTDPAADFVVFGYDVAGNVARTWDRNVAKDAHTAKTFPLTEPGYAETIHGSLTSPWRYVTQTKDALANTTTYDVDLNGNVKKITSPRGNATTQAYDAGDLRTQVLAPESMAAKSGDGADHPVEYTYDAYGNVRLVKTPRGATDVEAAFESFEYDASNRIVARHVSRIDNSRDSYYTTHNPAGCATTSSSTERGLVPTGRTVCSTYYQYAYNGQLVVEAGANGTVTRTYDRARRLLTERVTRVVPGSPDVQLYTARALNAAGDVVEFCRPRQYDPLETSWAGTTAPTCAAGPKRGSSTTYWPSGGVRTESRWRDATAATVSTRSYTYDGNGNRRTQTDETGSVTTSTFDARDRLTKRERPRTGQAAALATAFTYDRAGNLLTQTNAAGDVTGYVYDSINRRVETVSGLVGDRLTALPDANGGTNARTRYVYDPDGNVTDVYAPRAFAGAATQNGRLVPSGRYRTHRTYDGNGRLFAEYVPRADSADPATSSLADASDADAGQCSTATSAGFAGTVAVCVTRFGYDYAGLPTIVIGPRSRALVSAPSGGKPVGTNGAPSPDGRYTVTTYTDDGVPWKVETPDPSVDATMSPNGARSVVTTTTHYDAAGRAVQVDAPGGVTETREYTSDGLLRKLSATGYTSGASVVTHETSRTYDYDGNVRTETDLAGFVSENTWYADGLLQTTKNGAGETTKYTYDKKGNLSQVHTPSATALTSPNPQGQATTMSYTLDNLLEEVVAPVVVPASGDVTWRVTSYGYDAAGRRTSSSDRLRTGSADGGASGARTYTYYRNGRLATMTGTDGAATEFYRYDADGNRTMSAVRPTATAPAAGAACDRVTICATHTIDGLLRQVTSEAAPGVTSESSFAYDGDGRMTTRRLTTGSATDTTVYGYVDAGLPKTATASLSPDPWRWKYDAAGRLIEESQPNGQTMVREYYADGTLRDQLLKTASGSAVTQYSFTYDNAYRRKTQRLNVHGADAGTLAYTYNSAGRLQTFVDGAGTHAVSWDVDGNRTGYAGRSYTYRADGSIATEDGTSYDYDPSGLLTSTGAAKYCYDAFQRLTGVGAGAQCGDATYGYDALGREATTTMGSATTYRTYSGRSSNVVREDIGGDTRAYVLGAAGQELGLRNRDGSVGVLTPDGTGSTSTEVGSDGTVRCLTRYEAFGDAGAGSTGVCQTGVGAATTENEMLFNGERRDPLTGDYVLGSRRYDPTSATFLSRDDVAGPTPSESMGIGVDPLTLNRYSYVNGDPINYIDPSGHCRVSFVEDVSVSFEGAEGLEALSFDRGGPHGNRDTGGDEPLYGCALNHHDYLRMKADIRTSFDAFLMDDPCVFSLDPRCEPPLPPVDNPPLIPPHVPEPPPGPDSDAVPVEEPEAIEPASDKRRESLYCKVTGSVGMIKGLADVGSEVMNGNLDGAAAEYGKNVAVNKGVKGILRRIPTTARRVKPVAIGIGLGSDLVWWLGACGEEDPMARLPGTPVVSSSCRYSYNSPPQTTRWNLQFYSPDGLLRGSKTPPPHGYSVNQGCEANYTIGR